MGMKVSIVIAVLDSHEIVRRQALHFKKMGLPETVEIILVDDGSSVPIKDINSKILNIYYTNNRRPWTQGIARNFGVSKAKGEFIFITDIDHIITKEAIDAVLNFDGDKMVFPRYYGILDEDGNIVCNEKSMLEFGLHPVRVRTRRGYMCAGLHGNTFAIRKSIFDKIGGYDPRLCETGFHMGGRFASEEGRFNIKYNRMLRHGEVKQQVVGPKVYCYPIGKFRVDGNNNPFGLFHTLSLEQIPQPMIS